MEAVVAFGPKMICYELSMMSVRLSSILYGGGLFVAYYAAGWLGLSLHAINQFAALIWAPTGIALAGLLVFGYKAWPIIATAAFFLNWSLGAPALAASFMALGNTFEAMLGVFFLRRFASLPRTLEKLTDVLIFVVLVAGVSTLVSPTVGVAGLWLARQLPHAEIFRTWQGWWLGDVMGDLVVAPLLLVWGKRAQLGNVSWKKIVEAGALSVTTLLTSLLVFTGWFGSIARPVPGAYFLFPIVLWASIRFRQRGAIAVTFLSSVIALTGALTGSGGVFDRLSVSETLFAVQAFLAILAITGLVTAAMVSERQQRQQKLEAVNQHLERCQAQTAAVLESSLDCILTIDREGRILEFNPAAEKTFGWTRASVLGREMAQVIIPPSLREAHRRGLAHYLSTGAGQALGKRIEVPALRADGTEFPVELSITKLNLEGPPLFTGYLRDISDRRHNEEERSQALLRETTTAHRLNAQYEVMSVVTETGTLKEAGPRILKIMCENLAWELGVLWLPDIEGGHLRAVEVWNHSRLPTQDFVGETLQRRFRIGEGLPGRVWANKEPVWTNDVRIDSNFPRSASADKDGLQTAIGFPILIENNILGILEFFCRGKREADPELLTTLATLGGQIGQFLDRQKALKEAKEAVNARDEFISIASHELKTPLTSLSLQLQMNRRILKAGLDSPSASEKLDEGVESASRQVQRLVLLVEELLDVTRINAGKLHLQLKEVNLSELVEEVLTRFCTDLKDAECPIELDLHPNIVGYWDSFRIEQVLVNLISNAIKYAPRNSIRISTHFDAGTAKLRVQDFGPGISRDRQARIFERFERADSSSKVNGLGLGLFIARQILEHHQGSITIQSEPGVGSTFTVTLPTALKRQEKVREPSRELRS